jgi:hypothetical protein
MAVVQISRIQVRRGQKIPIGDVPQLSSAELAWAVDTQELFIGNGSLSEGAPYVGNTKVLTEHDDIFSLLGGYQFAGNDVSIVGSVPRSLQSKLDEYVSVIDFGAVPDGSTDSVEAFQNALTALFRNPDATFKKVLLVPNGNYVLSSNLRIPSTAIIQGETQDGAVININNSNILFSADDVNGNLLEIGEFTDTYRPRNISISNLTIAHNLGQIVITGSEHVLFDGVKFKGQYTLGEPIDLEAQPGSVSWANDLLGTRVTDIKFKNCKFENTALGIRSDQIVVDPLDPPVFPTFVDFEDCKFFVCDTGVFIDGVIGQGNRWRITDCDFEEIANNAFKSTAGTGTHIRRSRFINVGNGTQGASLPQVPMVHFGEKVNNLVLECTTDRQQAAGFVSDVGTASIVEVFNGDKTSFVNRNYALIYPSDSFSPLAVFSGYTRYIVINYFLSLEPSPTVLYSRVGKLTITRTEGAAEVAITDEYQYSSQFSETSAGGLLMTNFEFSAELRDNLIDSALDTVVLSYRNPLPEDSTPAVSGNITFDVTYGV